MYPAADPIIPSVGCEELDKENVPLKKTAVAARNVAENKQRKTKGLEYLRKDGSAVRAGWMQNAAVARCYFVTRNIATRFVPSCWKVF